MKKIEYIGSFIIISVTLSVAAYLFYASNYISISFDVVHAQQAYEKLKTNPHSMSAEEAKTFIGSSIKSDLAIQEVIESLLNVAKLLSLFLLILAFHIGQLLKKLYKKDNHESS